MIFFMIAFLIMLWSIGDHYKKRQHERFLEYVTDVVEEDWRQRTGGKDLSFLDIGKTWDNFDHLMPWEDNKFPDCIVRRK